MSCDGVCRGIIAEFDAGLLGVASPSLLVSAWRVS